MVRSRGQMERSENGERVMPEKQSEVTEDELRAIIALTDSGAAYGDFPDGVTWADLEAAKELTEKED